MAISEKVDRIDEDFSVAALMSPSGDGLSVVRDSRRAPTGMDPLDRILGGGIRAGDLVLLGGRPGVGKTVVGLQWARAVARSGGTAMIASYEHDEVTLLGRMVAMEIGMLELGPVDSQVEALVTAALNGDWGPGTEAGRHPLVRAAVAQIETYADNLQAEASQGSHFFHNITTLGLGYLTVAKNKTDFIDWEWLMSLPVIEETDFVRHVRFDQELLLKIDGKSSVAVGIKPL
jgi:RecA/RadA recombinase